MQKFWPFESFYKTNLKISKEELDQIKIFMLNFKNSVDDTQITTYQKINVLDLPILKNLRNQVVKILDSLNLILDGSWAQLYKENNFHFPHVHYGSDYSGIIYMDGHNSEGTNFLNVRGNIYTSKFKKKDLILFPSYVLHFVNVQKKDNNRTVISFNAQRRK